MVICFDRSRDTRKCFSFIAWWASNISNLRIYDCVLACGWGFHIWCSLNCVLRPDRRRRTFRTSFGTLGGIWLALPLPNSRTEEERWKHQPAVSTLIRFMRSRIASNTNCTLLTFEVFVDFLGRKLLRFPIEEKFFDSFKWIFSFAVSASPSSPHSAPTPTETCSDDAHVNAIRKHRTNLGGAQEEAEL